MKWFNSKKVDQKLKKCISVYISSEHAKILVAPRSINEAGVYFEQEDIEVLGYEVTNGLLGQSIKENLDKFSQGEKHPDKHKLTDWPAYKASKLKTVKEFEEKFSSIWIGGINESNFFFKMEAETDSIHKINLYSSINANASPEEYGMRLRALHKARIEKVIE